MKVSEKSLELNVGAELLTRLRGSMNMPKAYLLGLTQRQEKMTGVDFFAQLPNSTRLFAFQFKAPIGPLENFPYKFTLNRDQHSALHDLALQGRNAVYYVFPFYATTDKLVQDVPNLAQDTWLLPVAPLAVPTVFASQKTKRVQCYPGSAIVNPEYGMKSLSDLALSWEDGIQPNRFADWYRELRHYDWELEDYPPRTRPQIVRSLRVMIIGRHG